MITIDYQFDLNIFPYDSIKETNGRLMVVVSRDGVSPGNVNIEPTQEITVDDLVQEFIITSLQNNLLHELGHKIEFCKDEEYVYKFFSRNSNPLTFPISLKPHIDTFIDMCELYNKHRDENKMKKSLIDNCSISDKKFALQLVESVHDSITLSTELAQIDESDTKKRITETISELLYTYNFNAPLYFTIFQDQCLCSYFTAALTMQDDWYIQFDATKLLPF